MEDIAPQLLHAISSGPNKFKAFRRTFNGDGTIKYLVRDDQKITLTCQLFEKIRCLVEAVSKDNLERPFFIVFDDIKLCAYDIIVGEAGDESYCEHNPSLCRESQVRLELLTSLYPDTKLRLSRGHTHPVFHHISPTAGALGCQQFLSISKTVTFGALPSNVFGDLQTWQDRKKVADRLGYFERSNCIQKDIISPRLYKKFCEDYIESYMASHRPGFNAPIAAEDTASRFHWIITPRLQQIGIFEVPRDEVGVVMYYPWQVEGVMQEEEEIEGKGDGDEKEGKGEHKQAIMPPQSPLLVPSFISPDPIDHHPLTQSTDDVNIGGGSTFWCLHTDCTESVENFKNEGELQIHWQAHH
jgi:hypothetical protein